ncbi:DUF6518 family protein [Streptomyces sp. SYSU K217416]
MVNDSVREVPNTTALPPFTETFLISTGLRRVRRRSGDEDGARKYQGTGENSAEPTASAPEWSSPDARRGRTLTSFGQSVLTDGWHALVNSAAGWLQSPFSSACAVVVFLADVHVGPDLGHGHLRQLVLQQQSRRRPRRRCRTK